MAKLEGSTPSNDGPASGHCRAVLGERDLNRVKAGGINKLERARADVPICTDSATQPNRITLDISPGRRVVIAEVVVDLSPS
jgi:hypothetical protein